MKRRELITAVGGALAGPSAAWAQQPKRIARIGFFAPPPRNAEVEAFLEGLRDLGWVEGKNIHVEYRDAGGDDSRLPALAAELVGLDIDVLVTATTAGVLAAHSATTTIPTVMITGYDLVALGLAKSLARPGGNITGLTFFASELAAKRLDLLKSLAPSMTRAGVLLLRGSPVNGGTMAAMTAAAQALKVELRPIEVSVLGDLDGALSATGTPQMDGLVITDTNLLLTNASVVAAAVEKTRLPSIAAPMIASQGVPLGYGVDFNAMFRQGAVFVDRILKGARPADMPIEQPTKFKTIVNLKAAKAFGVEIPPMLLARADEVIE
ncbi:MAG: ABC transporter substrate-binding protein [Alphaproteobacteria bacterium]|nr:ABC transporter substrate-binding protein [Alphaproteobacteria bacterium]